MGLSNLESVVQIVAILGGSVAALLAALEIVDTYLDIGKKLREQRRAEKEDTSQTIQQESSET